MEPGTLIALGSIAKLAVVGGVTLGFTTSLEWFHGFKLKPNQKGVKKNATNGESVRERLQRQTEL